VSKIIKHKSCNVRIFKKKLTTIVNSTQNISFLFHCLKSSRVKKRKTCLWPFLIKKCLYYVSYYHELFREHTYQGYVLLTQEQFTKYSRKEPQNLYSIFRMSLLVAILRKIIRKPFSIHACHRCFKNLTCL
jgi:predicted acetyltransferase